MDWHELEKMKVADLRAMAKEKTELTGLSGLHKEDLVATLAKALGISKPHLVVDAGSQGSIKEQIRALKVKRQEALDARESNELKRVRKKIHRLRRKLRKEAHLT